MAITNNILGAKNQFALAYNIGTKGLSTTNDKLTNTLTDTATTFVVHFRGIKNNSTEDFLFGDVITNTGRYEYTVFIENSYRSLYFKHNGVAQDLGIYIPAVSSGRWILSFNVVGYNPSIVGGLEITEIMLRPAETDSTYVPYSMANSELTYRVNNCESTNVSSCHFYKHSDGIISVSSLVVLPMTIPEGFRPEGPRYAIAQGYNGSTQVYLTFWPDGLVTAGDNKEQTGEYLVSCTYKL